MTIAQHQAQALQARKIMAYDKRTSAQREFDAAIHGWAFSNDKMLKGKIKRAEEIALKLPPNDPRFATLQAMIESL